MVSPQKIIRKRCRREILRMGSAISGMVVSGSILHTSNLLAAQQPASSLPWPWKEIEPDSIQERAYQSTWAKNACMFGILEAVLGNWPINTTILTAPFRWAPFYTAAAALPERNHYAAQSMDADCFSAFSPGKIGTFSLSRKK